MTPALVLLFLAAASPGDAPDPCSPVDGVVADRADAAEYRAVGELERAAGSRDTAAAAFRAALARDPSDSTSRAALAELCRDRRGDGAFARGLRLMESGDRRGAVAAFEEARAGGPDGSPALLAGICLYELGEDERAAPLLRAAEADPAHRDSARFFLGLIALRAGRSDDAASLLDSVSSDRHLGDLALELARTARRDGRLVLSMLAESGWDSNVDLTPDTSNTPAQNGYGSMGLTAVGQWRPTGESGPFLRVLAHWRDQLGYDALDVLSAGAAAGWQAGRGRRFLLAEYAYDFRDVGGAPYLHAHRLLGTGRAPLGSAASAGATYLARLETFLTAASASYSGLRQLGEADVTWDVGRRSTATVAWRVGRDDARTPPLSWWETGPRAAVRVQVTPDVSLGADAALSLRRHDAVDPAFSVARADAILDVTALADVELADRWTLRLSATARRTFSNIADFEYTQLVPMLGLAYAVGIF